MARSLSLAAYLAYARRASQGMPKPGVERPDGHVIWCHAVDLAHVDALLQLAERLAAQRPGVHTLLTTRPDSTPDHKGGKSVIWQPLPEENLAAAEAFLEHWKPDICIWTCGELQPAILTCADRMGIPLYLVDADERFLSRPSWRWLPDLNRSVLEKFSMVMVRSLDTARYLRRIGVRDTQIAVSGTFQDGAIPLPCDESDREELSSALRARPVWLAAMLQPEEAGPVLEAHRAISRLSHRALLIIVPDDVEKSGAFRDALQREELQFATWSNGEMPEETTQVLLADTRGELGLWYRLAPITFMGSSLFDGCRGRDPNEPAAHGSAILHGPNVGRYQTTYRRFARAGAARSVRDAESLAIEVQDLIPPDRSAAMAHAAWDVASESAAVTDRIVDLVQDTLDVLEAG